LNPHFGAISLDRGNHAIRVTGAGLTRQGIPRSVRYLARCLACAWLRRQVRDRCSCAADYSPATTAAAPLRVLSSWVVRAGPDYLP
jgi:hypothetical protein